MNPKETLLLAVMKMLFIHLSSAQNIDGGWSHWSRYPAPCDKPCGGGTQNITRTCSNPVRQGDGQACPGSNIEQRGCNTDKCQTSWSQWTGCSAYCDIGLRTRHTLCGEANCTGNQYLEESQECVDWNKNTCPSPCLTSRCPDYAKCLDISNETRPMHTCSCVMGFVMDAYGECSRPSPAPPIPRAIPTMNEEQKHIVIVITRTASTILLVMVGITLLLFLILRDFGVDRVIQMNMEIALEAAHLLLLFPNTMAEDNPITCRLLSIGLHYCFTACFAFMFLESIHMYSLVAFVVQANGLMSGFKNFLAGWGASVIVVLFSVCFHYYDYGGKYHCWLQMDTPLLYAELIPTTTLMILTIVMTEAAGNADYKVLENINYEQLFSAKVSQRTNMILCILIYAAMVVGMLSDYEQNLGLYSVFSILNAIIGFCVFFMHALGNHEIRRKLRKCFSCF